MANSTVIYPFRVFSASYHIKRSHGQVLLENFGGIIQIKSDFVKIIEERSTASGNCRTLWISFKRSSYGLKARETSNGWLKTLQF
jgi:hypothetical protein